MDDQPMQYFVPTGGEADRMLRAYGWTPLKAETKSSQLKAYSEWLSQPLDRPGPVLFNFPFPSALERLFFYRLARKGWPCIALINGPGITQRSMGVLRRFDVLVVQEEAAAATLQAAGRPVVQVRKSLRKALQEALQLTGD